MTRPAWILKVLGWTRTYDGNAMPLSKAEQEPDKRENLKSGIKYAAEAGDLKTVKVFFARWASITPKKTLTAELKVSSHPLVSALVAATAHKHTKVMSFLISKGVSINSTVLQAAVKTSSLETFQVLAACGWDVKKKGAEVLYMVTGHDDIVEWLLKKGTDPNSAETAFTALEIAAVYGSLKSVQLLVTYGADLRFSEALVLAAQVDECATPGRLDIMAYLLDSGIDIDYVERPYTYARRGGAQHKQIKPGRHTGGTALHRAVSSGDVAKVQLLLSRGANQNIQGLAARTPLEMAKLAKREEMVKILLRPLENPRAKHG